MTPLVDAARDLLAERRQCLERVSEIDRELGAARLLLAEILEPPVDRPSDAPAPVHVSAPADPPIDVLCRRTLGQDPAPRADEPEPVPPPAARTLAEVVQAPPLKTRALAVLERADAPLTSKQIAAQCGTKESSVYGVLTSLVGHRVVLRLTDSYPTRWWLANRPRPSPAAPTAPLAPEPQPLAEPPRKERRCGRCISKFVPDAADQFYCTKCLPYVEAERASRLTKMANAPSVQ